MTIALQEMNRRLARIEDAQQNAPDTPSSSKTYIVDIIKVVFGGWPALGFIILLLFFTPIRDALNTIPDKVKSADEISGLGLTLKSAITSEATSAENSRVSRSVPQLSSLAIGLLLNMEDSVVIRPVLRSGVGIKSEYAVDMSSKDLLVAYDQLRRQFLVQIYRHGKVLSLTDSIWEVHRTYREQNPGKVTLRENNRVIWELDPPFEQNALSALNDQLTFEVRLTSFGRLAKKVVIEAIAKQLTGE